MRTRFENEFLLRYAIRMLEHEAKRLDRIDVFARFVGFLSGTAVVASVTASSEMLGYIGAAVFAMAQGVDLVFRPSARMEKALAERAAYIKIQERQSAMSDEELNAAYDAAPTDVFSCELAKKLAFNEVVGEKGCDPSSGYKLNWFDRALAAFV